MLHRDSLNGIADYKNYNKECGEKLFIDFAKKHKSKFIDCKLNESTENKFEYR